MPLAIALEAVEEALRRETHAPPGASHPDLLVILHGGEPLLCFPLIRDLVTAAEEIAAHLGKTRLIDNLIL